MLNFKQRREMRKRKDIFAGKERIKIEPEQVLRFLDSVHESVPVDEKAGCRLLRISVAN